MNNSIMTRLALLAIIAVVQLSGQAEGTSARWGWEFNGNYNDVGPSRRTLTVKSRVSWTKDPFGNVNRALFFNQGFLQTGKGNFFPNKNAFTIAAYVKPSRHNHWQRVIDFGNGANNNNILLAASQGRNGKPSLHIYDGSRAMVRCYFPQSLSLNQWTHIASVVDNGQVRNYVNGRLVKSCNFKNTRRSYYTHRNYIGRSNWGHDQKFFGAMDDVKLFRSALSSFDINELRGSKSPAFAWKFNGNFLDSGPKNRHLTKRGKVSFTSNQLGASNRAVFFNGGYATAPRDDYFPNPTAFTIAAWIKPRRITHWARVIDFGTTAGNKNVILAATSAKSGKPSFHMYDNGRKSIVQCYYPRPLPLNQWSHIATVVDGNQVRNYVNGNEVSRCNFRNTRTSGYTTRNYVAKSNWGHDRNFIGSISGIQIYASSLSAIDIAKNKGAPIALSKYRFNGNYLDSGTARRNVIRRHRASFTTDPQGNVRRALYLNNGYVQVPKGNYFPNRAAFTVAAWVKPHRYNKWSRVLDFGNGAANNNIVLAASTGRSGKPSFHLFHGRIKIVGCYYPRTIPLNQWTHVASVVNGNKVHNYVNGVLVNSCNFRNIKTVWYTNRNYIGKSNWGHDALYQGALDRVQILPSALSTFDLNHERGEAKASNEWEFNGNLADSGTLQRSLRTSGRTYFTGDMFRHSRSSLYFNGGYAYAPKGNYFKNPASFSVAAWVRPRRTTKWSRVIDFGNGAGNNNVVLAASSGTSGKPSFHIYNGRRAMVRCNFPRALQLNEWTHIVSVVDNNKVRNFVNGNLVATCNFKNNRRSYYTHRNYVGRSNWGHDARFIGTLDRLQFFPIALTKYDLHLMNNQPRPSFEWQLKNNILDAGAGKRNLKRQGTLRYVNDAFGNAKSAVKFSNSWVSAPRGNYFPNQRAFTIAAWVKPSKVTKWARVLDFGNGASNNNIVLAASTGTSGKPSFHLFRGNRKLVRCNFPSRLALNKWTHIATVLDGDQIRNYINGYEVSVCNFRNTRYTITTSRNYLAKSNWSWDAKFFGALAGVQIYKRALDQSHLHNIANNIGSASHPVVKTTTKKTTTKAPVYETVTTWETYYVYE